MPYHTSRGFERARKLGHVPTAENPEIAKKLGLYRRPDSTRDGFSVDPLLVSPESLEGSTDPAVAFAVAIDGSSHEYEEAFDRFPSTRVLYFQIAGVFCDLREMLYQQGPFVSPARIADAVEEAVIPGFLPSSHLDHAVYDDPETAFRAELFEFFAEKQINDRPLTAILLRVQRQATPEDAAAGARDMIRVSRCPNPLCVDAAGQRTKDILVPAAAPIDCSVCGTPVWPTDVLRLHEAFNPEGSNLEVLGRALSAIEHLVIVGVALTIFDDAPAILPRCAFIVDGPLAQFGESAPLRLAILGVWTGLARRLRDRGLGMPVVVGIEKTGYAADHLRALRERIPDGTLMRLPDSYLRDQLKTTSWKETYYGRKFFYVSKGAQDLVITVPPLANRWSPYGSDAQTDRSDPAHYPTLKRTLALLDEIGTQLYENALIPVALAHSFAAYPLTTSTQVLRLLTEQTLGHATSDERGAGA